MARCIASRGESAGIKIKRLPHRRERLLLAVYEFQSCPLEPEIGCHISEEQASIRIWLVAGDLTVSSISISCSPPIRRTFGEWTLVSDEEVLRKIAGFRAARLRNETGGILIGHYDVERKTVYVIDALGSPPDSKEWPTVYIRGAEGLNDAVADIQRRTSTMLQYVGEWHSHPDGYSCAPSGNDKRAFAWLTSLMQVDGYPGLMLIEGQNTRAWYIAVME
jgi:hypothetical protein